MSKERETRLHFWLHKRNLWTTESCPRAIVRRVEFQPVEERREKERSLCVDAQIRSVCDDIYCIHDWSFFIFIRQSFSYRMFSCSFYESKWEDLDVNSSGVLLVKFHVFFFFLCLFVCLFMCGWMSLILSSQTIIQIWFKTEMAKKFHWLSMLSSFV